jgi:adenosylcobinamide-phosphate synthase
VRLSFAPRRSTIFTPMTLFSLIAAFALEQFRPLPYRKLVVEPLEALAQWLESHFNAGERRHGMIAWLIAVGAAVTAAAAIHWLLWTVHPLLAFAWNVVVLYFTMGFRHLSHYFGDIHDALEAGELDRARGLLAEWRGRGADRASSGEVARLAIEEALVGSHRHVFAVVLWFVLLPGPSGAVMYRMAEFLARQWGARREPEFGAFGEFARRAHEVIDWLPTRVTAFAFAIVGDFEDAVYCWRTQAARWSEPASGILLASGAGALGVRLGMPVYESGEITERPEIGLGDDADADLMQSTIGLVWRTVVLCILILMLLGVASWVGA